MIYNHNQIQTRTKEVVIGKDYAYFEEFPNAIVKIKQMMEFLKDPLMEQMYGARKKMVFGSLVIPIKILL